MNRKIRVPLWLVILVCALLIFALIWPVKDQESIAGWGDNGGGRESYTAAEIKSGVLGDTVIFNSISDSTIGNEKNFVGARLDDRINAGADNVWDGNEIAVEDGAVYLIRAYVHNNSPLGYDALAENVKVAFSIPTVSAKIIPVNGFIFCDNATPSEYWDGVTLTSDNFFHLEYIYGSALLENDEVRESGSIALSDEIVTKAASNNGTLIGYSSLNGEIPGGCASYVTLKVRVVFDYDYTITAKARQAGATGANSWSTQTTANIGDEVEFQMEYRNTSANTQENVMIKDILPASLEYVSGSTLLYNSKYDGASVDQDSIVTTGINIGSYAAGANAYIRFTAKIVDTDLADGSNTLVNWAQCGVGQTTLQDYAAVVVKKTE